MRIAFFRFMQLFFEKVRKLKRENCLQFVCRNANETRTKIIPSRCGARGAIL